ncbi:hypothetical protein NDU88_007508 [Pleurodeles waltl]|uniref:Uncharacterized protein n=1 Tax=Pleurodeles waltl TaxID=8319 RepID=A0AAV7SSY8_PLEWA|nr:hypothetical protein NDU88_007508 [Pleurodeles waltl]
MQGELKIGLPHPRMLEHVVSHPQALMLGAGSDSASGALGHIQYAHKCKVYRNNKITMIHLSLFSEVAKKEEEYGTGLNIYRARPIIGAVDMTY